MSPTRKEAIRRLIGAAFDAGVTAATRPLSARIKDKATEQDYAASLFETWIEGEVRERLAQGGAS